MKKFFKVLHSVFHYLGEQGIANVHIFYDGFCERTGTFN
jgi:hypothetical protein